MYCALSLTLAIFLALRTIASLEASASSSSSESMAQRIAAQSGIQLAEAHWEVIRYVRDYYLERGFVRRSRELSSALNARFRKQGGKKYLYRLFHGGPVLKACRLGGRDNRSISRQSEG